MNSAHGLGSRQATPEPGDSIFGSLGMTDVMVDGADLAIELPVSSRIRNSNGALLGGLTASLIDVLAGRLAIRDLTPEQRATTNDMTVHFLAPITEGPARAEGRVLRRGRRSVVVHVDVLDLSTGKLAAVGVTSFSTWSVSLA
jgi:uncharacterized protein (TIGR00369 family)